MTAVRTPVPAAGSADAVPGPVPRRVRPPRWLDLRLVLGVLLVLGSVLLGARVVGAADATVPVWAVSGDLAAGTRLEAGDLRAVDVRLGDASAAYLSTSTRPEGRTLGRDVRAGELLPRAALDAPTELVQLALPVQSGYVPPGLERGQVVDVYAVAGPVAGPVGGPVGGATGAAAGSVTPVVRTAPVAAISGRSQGVLSTPTTAIQVVVSVAAKDAPAVLAAIAGRPLVVVVHDSAAGGSGVAEAGQAPAAGPTS